MVAYNEYKSIHGNCECDMFAMLDVIELNLYLITDWLMLLQMHFILL